MNRVDFTTPGIASYTTPGIIRDTTPGITKYTDNIIRAIYVLNFYYLLHKRNNGEFLVNQAVVGFPGHGEFEKKAVAAM